MRAKATLKLTASVRAMLDALIARFDSCTLQEYQKDIARIYSDAKRCNLPQWQVDDAIINCVLYHAGV